jgi:hypothetical protein
MPQVEKKTVYERKTAGVFQLQLVKPVDDEDMAH